MATGILINPSGVQDIDGVLWGWCWQINQPNNHTLLTYSFPTSTAAYGYEVNGFQAFNSAQVAAAEKALAMYDAVCNVDFQFSFDPAAGNIRFAEANSVNLYGSITIETALGVAPDAFAAPAAGWGDTWFNHTSYNNPTKLGSFAFAAGIMHELGHALGLKHGHDSQQVHFANGAVAYTNPTLPANHDSLEYSVMTYRSRPGASVDKVFAKDFPSTLMQDDILALQYLYGANYDHNAGDTVYRFSPKNGAMFIDGVSQGATSRSKIFLTIWDGDGNDTYNFSNYTSNTIINLNPGEWSTPSKAQLADLDIQHPGRHFARGCIANAVLFPGDDHGFIENAIGSKARDLIIGNEVSNALLGNAGRDVIYAGAGIDGLLGGRGRDALYGEDGADFFTFRSVVESGHGAKFRDSILDFNGLEGDVVDLSLFDANSRSAGLQHFTFIDIQAFHHTAGELRFANHLLQGDVNGDGKVDFEVYLNAITLFEFDLKLE
jgi:serralysin